MFYNAERALKCKWDINRRKDGEIVVQLATAVFVEPCCFRDDLTMATRGPHHLALAVQTSELPAAEGGHGPGHGTQALRQMVGVMPYTGILVSAPRSALAHRLLRMMRTLVLALVERRCQAVQQGTVVPGLFQLDRQNRIWQPVAVA